MWQERRNSSRATRIALLVARGRLPRQHGGGDASLARELVEELVAVHKSTALDRLNAPGATNCERLSRSPLRQIRVQSRGHSFDRGCSLGGLLSLQGLGSPGHDSAPMSCSGCSTLTMSWRSLTGN